MSSPFHTFSTGSFPHGYVKHNENIPLWRVSLRLIGPSDQTNVSEFAGISQEENWSEVQVKLGERKHVPHSEENAP